MSTTAGDVLRSVAEVFETEMRESVKARTGAMRKDARRVALCLLSLTHAQPHTNMARAYVLCVSTPLSSRYRCLETVLYHNCHGLTDD